MKLIPAKEKQGVKFRRVDVDDTPEVKAIADNVTDTQRSTTIEKGKAKVQTIEHLMAALYAIGVDNVLIEIDNDEVPIYDGSAIEFIQKINEVGLTKQQEERNVFHLDENMAFSTDERDSEIFVVPFDSFQAFATIQYDNDVISNQSAELKSLNSFEKEIAPARTFCMLSELNLLLNHDLIKGGNAENAVVYVDEEINVQQADKLKSYFNLKELTVQKGETLNDKKLRFNNEAARHKLLDFIGDLALIGCRINARFYVSCPGHTINTKFAKHLSDYIKTKKHLLLLPKLDLNADPVYDIHQIASMLPHRYPFLLVDKILKLGSDEIIGMKNLTFNEAFFQGHFPDNAIMPGVLQIEAMAQTGGILALSTVEDPENYWTYFLKIDQTKFKHPIRPGDTAIFQLKLLKPIRRGIVEMKANTFVRNVLATEAILTAQIVRKA
ncbi:UNVERIFIED_CONTAM: hypothetical protein GTU68_033104 [Idotea baltica]|nr:hypothetical protein [Idotea baltica]